MGATDAELARLRAHLCIDGSCSVEEIKKAYVEAADNTFATLARPIVKTYEPAYDKILRLIYRELRSYSESFDETWKAVKSLKFWRYKSPVEDLDIDELEDRIFRLYAAEYADAKRKAARDPNFWFKASKYLPGLSGASTGAMVTATAATATRLPFAGMAPGLVVGPVGIALAVVLIGAQASGPAFRKIVPATVELILIDRRIQFTPED
jgi:hypothetical protein